MKTGTKQEKITPIIEKERWLNEKQFYLRVLIFTQSFENPICLESQNEVTVSIEPIKSIYKSLGSVE